MKARKYNWPLITLVMVCCFLLLARITKTDNFRYIFLIWNLILAYVPYVVAKQIQIRNGKKGLILNLCCSFIWLLFFPNAPYIVSDFIHLHHSTSNVLWYDVTLLFMFAFTGMYMAIKSATIVHTWLINLLSKGAALICMLCCFFLSGFGVYLGRVERWNSWNIIDRPFGLLREAIVLLSQKTVWEYSVVYFILITTIYMLFRFEKRQGDTI